VQDCFSRVGDHLVKASEAPIDQNCSSIVWNTMNTMRTMWSRFHIWIRGARSVGEYT
jgi:hypothetical protein